MNVFSAFGKTTNELEKALKSYINGDIVESQKTLNELKIFHIEIARELFPKEHIIFGAIEDIFKKIQHTLSLIRQGENEKYIYLYLACFFLLSVVFLYASRFTLHASRPF